MIEITSLDDFRSKVSHREEIREAMIGENLSSFCYMISSEGTFDSPELRECRGIVFNTKTGKVAGRPLHKFFNVGEREETRVENLDWSKVVRVMDKRDGSMIHTVKTENGFALKSKKSFDSDVAKAATKWIHSPAGAAVKWMVEKLVSEDMTLIFEWTSPDARIVLFYPESELQLLHVRDNITGLYMSLGGGFFSSIFPDIKIVSQDRSFFVVDDTKDFSPFDIKLMLEAAKTREGIEGWIVQFSDGNMVKIKTDWYLLRHRAMTFIRERDIAQLVLDEGLDDMKSLLVGDGINIDEILAIETCVAHDFTHLVSSVDSVYEEFKDMSRKDFAIKFNGHEHFGLLMHKFTGKTPNYKEYFERHILREHYSLRQLVMVPSIAEGD